MYFVATMQYAPGPTEGITTATYVPMGDMDPPNHIKSNVVLVWKAMEGALKANPDLYVWNTKVIFNTFKQVS